MNKNQLSILSLVLILIINSYLVNSAKVVSFKEGWKVAGNDKFGDDGSFTSPVNIPGTSIICNGYVLQEYYKVQHADGTFGEIQVTNTLKCIDMEQEIVSTVQYHPNVTIPAARGAALIAGCPNDIEEEWICVYGGFNKYQQTFTAQDATARGDGFKVNAVTGEVQHFDMTGLNTPPALGQGGAAYIKSRSQFYNLGGFKGFSSAPNFFSNVIYSYDLDTDDWLIVNDGTSTYAPPAGNNVRMDNGKVQGKDFVYTYSPANFIAGPISVARSYICEFANSTTDVCTWKNVTIKYEHNTNKPLQGNFGMAIYKKKYVVIVGGELEGGVGQNPELGSNATECLFPAKQNPTNTLYVGKIRKSGGEYSIAFRLMKPDYAQLIRIKTAGCVFYGKNGKSLGVVGGYTVKGCQETINGLLAGEGQVHNNDVLYIEDFDKVINAYDNSFDDDDD